jgi:RNA polymerase sigma-70 factor (ECF subfamily)
MKDVSVSVHIEGAAMQDERRERFDTLYRLAWTKILAYALRRAPSAEDAADIAAETFTIAWRRLDQVPVGEEAILWLYAVARNVLHNEHRRQQRRSELVDRVARQLPESAWCSLPRDEEGLVALLCLRALSEDERELLMLMAWEGLRPADIARVLGCSPSAARVRVHRARRRLHQAIAATASEVGVLQHEVPFGHGRDGPRVATPDPQGGLTP